MDAHMKVVYDETYRDYRGQSYALDIVKLDALGLPAQGFFLNELERYAIFGDPGYAP